MIFIQLLLFLWFVGNPCFGNWVNFPEFEFPLNQRALFGDMDIHHHHHNAFDDSGINQEFKETSYGYLFKKEISGLRDGDVQIILEGNELSIKIKKNRTFMKHGIVEKSSESWSRTFEIDHYFDEHDVDASYNGRTITIMIRTRNHSKQPYKQKTIPLKYSNNIKSSK